MGSVLVAPEGDHCLDVTEDPASPVRLAGRSGRSGSRRQVTAAVLEQPDAVRWVVAYGANADPDRLRDKGLTEPGALLLPARLTGWVPAFEARMTGYGAVPLTLVPCPGRLTATWLLGVHVSQVEELDRTEGRLVPVGTPAAATRPAIGRARSAGVVPAGPASGCPSGTPAGSVPAGPGPASGLASGTPAGGHRPPAVHHAPVGTYRLGRVGQVSVADRFVIDDALAYLPGGDTRVQVSGDGWRTWPEHDQAAALAHLAIGGPWRHAPEAMRVVSAGWPTARLRRS